MELKNIKVGVLAGGVSEERDISLLSGEQVFQSLLAKNIKTKFIKIESSDKQEVKSLVKAAEIDIAFIALHGSFGEDGKIQAILEEIPIAYTGSGPEASVLAMDKVAAKERFKQAGIITPFYRLFSDNGYNCPDMNYPVVVKPRFSGSSFGVSIVSDKEEIKRAVKQALKFSKTVIIEDYVQGRELTVGILGEKPLAIVEIIPKGDYFDFQNKYIKGNSKFVVPAKLEEGLSERVKKTALTAHKALGCRDFSRVDLKIKNGIPYVLEVNSIPGLTINSLLPLSASASGIDFSQLIHLLLQNALLRAEAPNCGEIYHG
ncbi:MAG: D-alanine--D-alanine ligase [Candidatus Omnitrophica bacterium]|nr:D-alanine--D-alanine ligase [Candidatus Omnitrophota bacterium]MCF7892540.1 D-alanine--D-alanine ligase [Candidatus Omnitrophota bacterium]